MRNLCYGLAIATALVGTASRSMADDATNRNMAQQIADNLKQSGELRDYRVGVKYEDGTAWLMGTVTSTEQKIVAERLARRSAGVEKVVSKLTVAGQEQTPSGRNEQIRPASATELQQAAPQMAQVAAPRMARSRQGMPRPFAPAGRSGVQQAGYGGYPAGGMPGMAGGAPQPMAHVPPSVGRTVSYDNPQMPNYAWPSYAANPNYAALTYPKQYSASAWPYIGPFYPYPQVPLGWRKVTLEWDDGWWFLDFKDCATCK